MSKDTTSLDLLHDIVEPAAAAWWPPAPGWQVLMGLAGFLLVVAAFRGLARWQANRYRREALRELKRISRRGSEAAQLVALSALLKRTAISAYSRPRVAGLSGAQWFEFLDHSGGTRFSDGPGSLLESANYGLVREAVGPAQLAQLIAEARRWIVRHERAVVVGTAAARGVGDARTRMRDAA